jgi:CDP-glucose 4,6-dehydratase
MVDMLPTLSKIFKDKSVLITGHTGFIGSWLTLWLSQLGAKVTGYSLDQITNPSIFEILKLQQDISHITGNINDKQHIQDTLKDSKAEFIFHLAAQPLVLKSYKDPIETLETNIMGTANLLESLRNSTVKNCIIFTSDKCYHNIESEYAYNENDAMGGYDPYSASKGATELITTSFRNSFFNSNSSPGIATVRSGNVIGGGDWADDRIIPDCIRSLVLEKPIELRNPNAIRPFQHVLEPVSGLLCLAMKMNNEPKKFSESWNLGPDPSKKITVKDLVSLVIKEWKTGKWIDTSNKTDQKHEASTLVLDSSKAKKRLGWNPVYSISEAIKKTISWYAANEKKTDMRSFTINQINEYILNGKRLKCSWTE